MDLRDMNAKRDFEPLELNDASVLAVFSRCRAEGGSEWDEDGLKENRDTIRYLMGQLKVVHWRLDRQRVDGMFAVRYDNGTKWTADVKSMVNLLNMGMACGFCAFYRDEGKQHAALDLEKLLPTLSPSDPEFASWWDSEGGLKFRASTASRAGSLEKVLALYLEAAQRGSAHAQFECGDRHYYGEGTDMDKEKALYWFEKAAQQGHADAQFRCGEMYQDGVGTAADREKALSWFERAAQQGHTPAMKLCGLNADDPAQKLYWYERAAKLGDADAQFDCGNMYSEGRGTAADLERALYWFEKAGEQGHVDAQFNCGNMYSKGQGAERDMGQALYWYKKAAEQDDADACYMCGFLYTRTKEFEGDTSEEDPVLALYWYEKAAGLGNATAQYLCGTMYYNGQGTERDRAKAYDWFKKAAEQTEDKVIQEQAKKILRERF